MPCPRPTCDSDDSKICLGY